MSSGSKSDSDAVIVCLVTAPSQEAADALSRQLVEERLVACVNTARLRSSVYFWKEEVQHDTEELLIIKTRQSLFGRLERRITELHPYDVPEIIALSTVGVSEGYERWVLSETREGTS